MQLVTNIIALATLPARSELAAERFHQAQLRAAEEDGPTRTRSAAGLLSRRCRARTRSFPDGIAVSGRLTGEPRLAARAWRNRGDEQARSGARAGVYADLTAQLTTARQRAASEREALIRAMGLWGSNLDFKLPNALPAVPRRVQTWAGIEVDAVGRRVDLQIARIELDVLAKSYGLTQATRFINILDGGYGR